MEERERGAGCEALTTPGTVGLKYGRRRRRGWLDLGKLPDLLPGLRGLADGRSCGNGCGRGGGWGMWKHRRWHHLGAAPSELAWLGLARQRGMAWHGVAWHRVRASTCQVAPAHACQPIHRQVSTSNNVGRPSKSPTHGCSPGRPSGGRLDLMGDTRPRRGQTRGRQQVQARDGPLPRGGAQPSPALPCHRLLACSALPTAPLPCPGRAASSTRQRRARCLCCGHSAQAVLSSAWWAPY